MLAGVFTLGAITGGAAVHFQHARRIHAIFGGAPQKGRFRGMVAALDREVALDDAQRAKVREIVAAHEPEMKEIRRSVSPRITALHATIAGEIRSVLRPDQMDAFDRFLKKQEERTLDEH